MVLFHGTNKNAADKIMATGVKKSECSDYGKAFYLSTDKDYAAEYAFDNTILSFLFTGKLLDLSIGHHWEAYKINGNKIPRQFDALKDGQIIAVYNVKKLKLLI